MIKYLGSIKKLNSGTVYHIHERNNGSYRVNRISQGQTFSKEIDPVPAFVQKYIRYMEINGATKELRYCHQMEVIL